MLFRTSITIIVLQCTGNFYCFYCLFRQKRIKLLESCEEQEGDYHGEAPTPLDQPAGRGGGTRRRLTMKDLEEWTDEEGDNSMDDEFMD